MNIERGLRRLALVATILALPVVAYQVYETAWDVIGGAFDQDATKSEVDQSTDRLVPVPGVGVARVDDAVNDDDAANAVAAISRRFTKIPRDPNLVSPAVFANYARSVLAKPPQFWAQRPLPDNGQAKLAAIAARERNRTYTDEELVYDFVSAFPGTDLGVAFSYFKIKPNHGISASHMTIALLEAAVVIGGGLQLLISLGFWAAAGFKGDTITERREADKR